MSERAKLAEERRASSERGGRPCLGRVRVSSPTGEEKAEVEREHSSYFTRSARLSGCRPVRARFVRSRFSTGRGEGGVPSPKLTLGVSVEMRRRAAPQTTVGAVPRGRRRRIGLDRPLMAAWQLRGRSTRFGAGARATIHKARWGRVSCEVVPEKANEVGGMTRRMAWMSAEHVSRYLAWAARQSTAAPGRVEPCLAGADTHLAARRHGTGTPHVCACQKGKSEHPCSC